MDITYLINCLHSLFYYFQLINLLLYLIINFIINYDEDYKIKNYKYLLIHHLKNFIFKNIYLLTNLLFLLKKLMLFH